ncbi:MAG: YbaK/EbsC family protein [Candidatus Bathyarchaeota archaeon]|nr:YbaK/EbsC family protein [Candidatus Bathyarchaeota archaeon]
MENEAVRLLMEHGVEHRIIELEERAISVQDVMKYAKTDIKPDEIAKTIIVKNKKGALHGVLLLGDHRIDSKKLNVVLGKTRFLSPDEVEGSTGMNLGEVCPLTLKIPILVDVRVLEKPRINFGSGNHLYGIEMNPRDLVKVIEYKTGDISLV